MGWLRLIAFVVLLPIGAPFALLVLGYWQMKKMLFAPKEREWFPSNQRFAKATIDGRHITLCDLRNLSLEQWKTRFDLRVGDEGPSPYHVDRTLDLDTISDVTMWFSPTHVFLTFQFGADDEARFVSVSVESRSDFVGGGWNVIGGLRGRYQLFPALCTEADILYRSIKPKSFPFPMLMFPIRDTRANASPYERSLVQRLAFLNAVARVQKCRQKPEHYGYLNNSCATNTMRIGNWAIAAVTRSHARAWLWIQGFVAYVMYSEAGMLRLLHRVGLIDYDRLGIPDTSSFDEVVAACDVTPQLIGLIEAGVTGDELSRALRQRFRH